MGTRAFIQCAARLAWPAVAALSGTLGVSGCGRAPSPEPAPPVGAALASAAPAAVAVPLAPSSAPASALSSSASSSSARKAFGQPIDQASTTSLVDIAKTPAAYRGKVIATEGTVTRVCQEAGCWMAIKDDTGTATVRMHGHTFFVPTTSSGKHARVQGTVVLMKNGHECDEAEALDAKLELDATGVELM